jgi:hypothetical protein
MASHAQAYDRTERTPSENLTRFQFRQLVKSSGLSLGAQRTILASLDIADMGGSRVWCSVKSLSYEMRRAQRTVQYHRRRLRVVLGIARVVQRDNTWIPCPKCGTQRTSKICPSCKYEGNTQKEFRRGATYEFDAEKIKSFLPAPGVREFRNYREYRAGKKPRPSSPPPHRSTERAAAPSPTPISRPHTISRGEERLHKLRQQIGVRMAQLRKGYHGSVNGPEGLHFVSPGHPDYRPAMSHEEAERAVAQEFGLTLEQVQSILREMGWKYAVEKRE